MGNEPIRALDYDPFAPAVMNDPLPFYKELRRDHPVLYSEKYDGFFFSRFDDILELLRHVDNSFLQTEGSLPLPSVIAAHNTEAPLIPPTSPGFGLSQPQGMPIHGQVRRAHIKPMLTKGVTEMRAFVRDLANQRLDVLLPKGEFDLTGEFGGIVSSRVIMDLMGMPLELAGECLDIVNSGTRTNPETGGFDSRATAMKAIAFYLPWVEKRFAAGADGSVPMVDGLINWRFEGRALTPPEVAQNLVCAFIGGIETTPKITAHGLKELNDRPDQMAIVRSDLKTNVPKVVEEMLRYCAPAQWFMRTAHKPVTVAGQQIRPGQRAFAMIASGLRDEREFDSPDEFRWNRPLPRVLSFGYGMHICIGVHLARMEIQVMVEEFLRRVPKFSFDMDKAVRHPSSFQWGWNALPVVIG